MNPVSFVGVRKQRQGSPTEFQISSAANGSSRHTPVSWSPACYHRRFFFISKMSC